MKDILQLVANDIKTQLKTSGISATGNLVDSVKVEMVSGQYVITAIDYFTEALEGTKPNSVPFNQLQTRIREWLKLGKYGLPNNEGIVQAISRNIHTKGSWRHRYNKQYKLKPFNEQRLKQALEQKWKTII